MGELTSQVSNGPDSFFQQVSWSERTRQRVNGV